MTYRWVVLVLINSTLSSGGGGGSGQRCPAAVRGTPLEEQQPETVISCAREHSSTCAALQQAERRRVRMVDCAACGLLRVTLDRCEVTVCGCAVFESCCT